MGTIIGVGVDIIEIDRVEKSYERERFQKKYYSEAERELIQRKKARAATAFAGKEAVVKALGTGFREIVPSDIEILREPGGAPYIRLSERAEQIVAGMGIENLHISLSDSDELAIAYVVAEGEPFAKEHKPFIKKGLEK